MTSLTNQQIEAIQSLRSHVNVTAGPGCGKTETIAERVQWLLREGAAPESIAVVAFTRQAASELRARLNGAVEVGTLHSILLGWLESDLGYPLYVTQEVPATPNEQQRKFCALSGEDSVAVASLRSSYAVSGAVDYVEILVRGLELVKQRVPISHLIVDEAQDLDELQWAIIDQIGERANTFCVGDAAQSLYSFRGARVELWDNRLKSHSLTRCFRCPFDVIATANVLSNRAGCTAHPLFSEVSGGLVFEQTAEAGVRSCIRDFFLDTQIAVICRYNSTADRISDALKSAGLMVDRDAPPVKTPVSTLMQFLHCPNSGYAFKDLRKAWDGIKCNKIETLTGGSQSAAAVLGEMWVRSIGAATPAKVLRSLGEVKEIEAEAVEWSDRYRGMSLAEAVHASLGAYQRERQSGIAVWTIHSAKGREWPAVVAVDDFARINEEEYRAAYVQITRAKERCCIIPGRMYKEFVPSGTED